MKASDYKIEMDIDNRLLQMKASDSEIQIYIDTEASIDENI